MRDEGMEKIRSLIHEEFTSQERVFDVFQETLGRHGRALVSRETRLDHFETILAHHETSLAGINAALIGQTAMAYPNVRAP